MLHINREELEKSFLRLLRQKDFLNAVKLAYDSGCRGGLSVRLGNKETISGSAKNKNIQKEITELSLIFSRTPGIFKTVPAELLPQIRLIAGLYFLLGDHKPLSTVRFGTDRVPGTNILPNWAPNVLQGHASYWNKLEYYKSMSNKRLFLTIRNARDAQVCAACQALHGIDYSLNDVPELPYPKCTCEYGCRCYLHPVFAK
jgi:hypothetical protein